MMNSITQFPDDENGEVLRRMYESGDDLSKARAIDFAVVFPNEDAAKIFSSHFVASGYDVKIENASTVHELPWDVVVVKHMLPEHAGITAFEEQLEEMAMLHGGRNDGWGSFEQLS